MKKLLLIFFIGIAGIAIDWLSLLMGWWPITPLVGLLLGLVIRPGGRALLVAGCVGGLSWGLPLAFLAISAPVGLVAAAVESVIGLGATHGIVIIALTVILGCLLSIAGVWIAVACWHLVAAPGLTRKVILEYRKEKLS